ncbi:MAG: hypothetical protein QXP60_03660 [Nitrososphaerota archaeon]
MIGNVERERSKQEKELFNEVKKYVNKYGLKPKNNDWNLLRDKFESLRTNLELRLTQFIRPAGTIAGKSCPK